MPSHTRRRFLAAAATAAAATTLTGSAAAGDSSASDDQSLTAVVRLRFKHLSEAQIKAVQRGIQNGLAAAAVLNRIPLNPLDEPATVFVADLAE